MAYNCEILADSLSSEGNRLTTMKITFPRMMLAEMNTHRMFSRNSASSRAIPFNKMVKMVEENPFIPIAWQENHKGMQGSEYITSQDEIKPRINDWLDAKNDAVKRAKYLDSMGVTKQLCNRLLEPFMWHTVIVTATEWGNFFKLRCPQYETKDGVFKSKRDAITAYQESGEIGNLPTTKLDWYTINKSQADIHIQAIAELMWDAYNESKPRRLKSGNWHIPFGDKFNDNDEFVKYLMKKWQNKQAPTDGNLWEKIKIATARCARISYQTLGDNSKIDYEADIRLHDILAESGHWSPFEHVAKVMSNEEYSRNIQGYHNGDFDFGINGEGWCRNFRGFIQYRSLVDNKS